MAFDARYACCRADINVNCGGAMETNLNYNSERSCRARFGVHFGKWLGVLSLVLSVALSLLGVVMWLAGMPSGLLVVSLGLWVLIPFLWNKYDLKLLSPTKGSQTIDAVLAGDLLGRLPANPSPKQIFEAAKHADGGYFVMNRLGIASDFILPLISDSVSDATAVWQVSVKLWQGIGDRSNVITAPIVMAAIMLTTPGVDDLLRTHHVDNDDVVRVVQWFEHINYLRRMINKPRYTGGVARDWSFGYIPTLQHFGVNISQKYTNSRSLNVELESDQSIVDSMITNLATPGRRNVALIGPLGAGKSTVVESLADCLMDASRNVPAGLRFNQVFSLDATSIVANTGGRGQVEYLINRLLAEAYQAKNIVLFLDNADVFFEDGTGALDLSNLLQPILEGGNLKLVLAMDEQRFLQIMQAKPALASSLNRIEVKPATADETMLILEDRVLTLEYQSKCMFMYQALTEAIRLSNRYIQTVAQPRAAVQLLEQSVQQATNGFVTAQSISATIEKTLGIKVGGNLVYGDNKAERERLLNLENLIHERMINQKSAVTAVASALRRARAGVRNENRPIGTFLFLGPTGVGKTELAKALADVYFGGEGHMVRIDLNEYVRAEDVARLIADGATDMNSLSAQVQKNPFSVVLLDEIEKAHPNVLTTLLQVLDEGILRDINNREISFRDTIVIATSNAGAELIRQYIDAGYQVEQFASQIQDAIINSGEFRPEFLNRFDEVAVFRPLTKAELVQVVNLILKGVNKNLAVQKIAVAVDEDAKRLLVDAGYDPRLGARPMRRIVQRTVENIVANKMLSGELVAGSGIRLTATDIQNALASSM